MDRIDILIDEAHEIFNQTSVFEAIDHSREYAIEFLNEHYKNPPQEQIDKYLSILKELKPLVGG